MSTYRLFQHIIFLFTDRLDGVGQIVVLTSRCVVLEEYMKVRDCRSAAMLRVTGR